MNSQLKFKFLSWHSYFGLQKQVFNQIQELPSKLSPWFGGKFSSPPAVSPRRPRSLSSAGGHWLLFRNWKCGDFQCCHLSSTRLPLPCRIGSSWLSPGVWHVRDTWPPTEQEEEDSQDSEKQNGSTRSLDRRPRKRPPREPQRLSSTQSVYITAATRSLTSLEEHKACLIWTVGRFL